MSAHDIRVDTYTDAGGGPGGPGWALRVTNLRTGTVTNAVGRGWAALADATKVYVAAAQRELAQ